MAASLLNLPITVAGNVAEPLATPATNSVREEISLPINTLRNFLVASGGGNEEIGAVGNSLFLNGLPLPLPFRGEDPSEMGPSPNLKATAMRSDNDASKRSGLGPRHWRLYCAPLARRGTVGRTSEVGDHNRPERSHHHPVIDRAHWRTGSARRHQGRAGTSPVPGPRASADRATGPDGRLTA